MNDMMAPKSQGVGHKKMAARDTVECRGLRFRVGPDFWLRRLLFGFPFYFERPNPSFRVSVKRVAESPPGDDWEGGVIPFQILLADGTRTYRQYIVPELSIGESTKLILKNVYSPQPGQTKIILVRRQLAGPEAELSGLYSYHVRPEEAIWLAGAVVLITAFSVLIPLWITTIDDPPTVNIIVAPTAVSIAEATPTPEPTVIAPTPTPQPTLDTADPPLQ